MILILIYVVKVMTLNDLQEVLTVARYSLKSLHERTLYPDQSRASFRKARVQFVDPCLFCDKLAETYACIVVIY